MMECGFRGESIGAYFQHPMCLQQMKRHFLILDHRIVQPRHTDIAPGDVACQSLHPGNRWIEGAIGPTHVGGAFAGMHFAWVDRGNAAGSSVMRCAAIPVALRSLLDHRYPESL